MKKKVIKKVKNKVKVHKHNWEDLCDACPSCGTVEQICTICFKPREKQMYE